MTGKPAPTAVYYRQVAEQIKGSRARHGCLKCSANCSSSPSGSIGWRGMSSSA